MDPRTFTRMVAAIAAMAVLVTACTGRYPARLLAERAEGVRARAAAGPDSDQAAVAASPDETAAAQSAAPARSLSPGKVVKAPGGTEVVTSPGGLPKASLWNDAEDRIGLTNNTLKLCMHAAFVLGNVFNNHPEEEDVYWDTVNAAGGIHGRKVEVVFKDDAYLPDTTTQAMNQCRDESPFLYLGGVGFDQAPAARAVAESNRLPYMFSMAVEPGPEVKYSFSFVPSIQTNGRSIGQYVGSHFRDKKVGAVYVNTPNWIAGFQQFEAEIQKRGMSIAPEDRREISNNNADFLDIIADFKEHNVELVFAYINALALTRFIAQSDEQSFYPLIFSPDGFDLVPDTVGDGETVGKQDIMRKFPGIYAAWVSPAYEMGPPDAKARPSVSWYSEMQAMKAAYGSSKVPNDVDWMFWLYFKSLHKLLDACTRDCSRNVVAGLMLTGWKQEILGCPIDFSLDPYRRLGGHFHNFYKAEASGSRTFWRQIETCRRNF